MDEMDGQSNAHLLHYEKVRPLGDTPPPPDREPLVLTHGLFGSGNNLMTLARLFERERPVYLVDLPNHGKSPWIEDASYQDCRRLSSPHTGADCGAGSRGSFTSSGTPWGGRLLWPSLF